MGTFPHTNRVLGFRAEPHQFHWAVIEGTRHVPILVGYDKAAAPVTEDEARALVWYRERARLLIDAHKPAAIAVRSPEPVARGGTESTRQRLRLEGVLLEVGASAGLEVTTGALVSISSRLGTASAKAYLETGQFRGLDLSKVVRAAREAILVAASLLPEGA